LGQRAVLLVQGERAGWSARHRRAVVAALIALAVAGISARLWIWWTTKGTADVNRWLEFGRAVSTSGLAETYATDERFNHPPLMGLYASWVWEATGDNLNDFARGIKLLGLLGEGIVLAALARFAGLPAFVAYATAPAAILVSAWHGNTDTLMAAFVIVAAIAFDRDRFFTAGLSFGAALNVKLLPLVLLPLLLIGAPDRRALWRICAALALAAVPYIPLLVTSAGDLYDNMIAYNSIPNDWGLNAFFNQAVQQPELEGTFTPIRDAFLDYGRYLVLAGVIALALASRARLHFSMVEQFALGGSLFLLLTPGFGVQYTILVVAALILVDLPYGIAWAWLAGGFMAILYSAVPLTDFSIKHESNEHFLVLWALVGVLAWALLALFVWQTLSARYRRAATIGG
jgi:Glycosyltransferase family 87